MQLVATIFLVCASSLYVIWAILPLRLQCIILKHWFPQLYKRKIIKMQKPCGSCSASIEESKKT